MRQDEAAHLSQNELSNYVRELMKAAGRWREAFGCSGSAAL